MSKKNTPAPATAPAAPAAPETASAPLDPAPTITPPSIPVVALDPVPVGALAATIDPKAAEPVKVEDAARASVTVNVTQTVSDEDIADVVRKVLSREAPDAPALKVLDLGAADRADRDAERLAAALERNARLSATVSAIATHVMLSPETHTHLPEPDALSLLVELVRQTAEEFRALVRALEPGAAERVTAAQWGVFLRQRDWLPCGEALQGAALRYQHRDGPVVLVPVDGTPGRAERLAAMLSIIADVEHLPVTRVVALASIATWWAVPLAPTGSTTAATGS